MNEEKVMGHLNKKLRNLSNYDVIYSDLFCK